MSKKVLKVLVPFMLILWMIVGNALTLKAVGGDGCPGRKLLFAAHSWIRQS